MLSIAQWRLRLLIYNTYHHHRHHRIRRDIPCSHHIPYRLVHTIHDMEPMEPNLTRTVILIHIVEALAMGVLMGSRIMAASMLGVTMVTIGSSHLVPEGWHLKLRPEAFQIPHMTLHVHHHHQLNNNNNPILPQYPNSINFIDRIVMGIRMAMLILVANTALR
jgi:hypothetical protein